MKRVKQFAIAILIACWSLISALFLLGEPTSNDFSLIAWLFMKLGALTSLVACCYTYKWLQESGKVPRLWKAEEQKTQEEEL